MVCNLRLKALLSDTVHYMGERAQQQTPQALWQSLECPGLDEEQQQTIRERLPSARLLSSLR